MAWRLEIEGVDRTTWLELPSRVRIRRQLNERSQAEFVVRAGYVPNLGDDVVIYDQDGTTPIFGGIVFERQTEARARTTATRCRCVDWTALFDGITVASGAGLTGTLVLKGVLEWLEANYLAAYGFSLHPNQSTGPSQSVTGFSWERKYVSDVFRDLTIWSGGYLLSVSPTKVFRMELPDLNTPTAPFAISESQNTFIDLAWDDSRASYATRVILRCGGRETKAVTQTWTVTAQDIANGYLETDVPSTPTGGVSATVNGNPVTIGGAGSQLVWDWQTHRITAGTLPIQMGDVIALTYTAQFPFEVVADAGLAPPDRVEYLEDRDDITTKATGQPIADGILARMFQQPRQLRIVTDLAGLEPGQVATVAAPSRNAASLTAAIIEVETELMDNTHWRHTVQAVSGVYLGSPLDYFRRLSGAAPQPAPTYTGGINVAISAPTHVYLGGSLSAAIAVSPAAWTPVVDRVRYTAQSSFTARVSVTMRARNSGISVTARLQNLTDGTTVGQSSAVTSQSLTESSFTASIASGKTYELQVIASASGEGVYCVGALEAIGV